ncbi:Crp/Fnr family transcriptional regulator [Defluviimonas sp. WL0002]|uniref:Crp/Fnr family transcriptional regulator n=1 Tax=Albidovulum marisflavi TaxID=2984159 RepID=A0ABT2ZBB7_9RHOB|nr:Crp/Fnr family transcriptional regulator [Defluviimonas sp. WL0002]MCV2868399.1 Crp/Fnr family transcriptional regulator [Defluviimonas sp. WL0002]
MTDSGSFSQFGICDGARAGRPWHAEARLAFQRTTSLHKIERAAGALLGMEADAAKAVYFVLSGWLASSKSLRNGQRQIVDIQLPGEFIDTRLSDMQASATQIETLTPVTLAVVPRGNWMRLLQEYPEILARHERDVAAVLSRMSERMLRLGKSSAQARIAYTLIELGLRSSAFGPGESQEFHIPMTQQSLGDFTGLSSVHVCRTLGQLERMGVVSTNGHMDILIHDIEQLAAIAEIDVALLRGELNSAA